MKVTKRYSASDNGFIEANNGRLVGREWSDSSGNTYRTIAVNFREFDMANGVAVINFVKEIKPSGTDSFTWHKSYTAKINDKDYNYADPTKPNFGVYEPNPFNEDGSLKDGLTDEATFFSECFFFNSFGLPLDINTFFIATIDAKEGI
jgi:hypothetical protein